MMRIDDRQRWLEDLLAYLLANHVADRGSDEPRPGLADLRINAWHSS
jgi:hypothetical protein